MKRQAAQAVTCARCAAVVALDAVHCGICWWPVNAPIAAAEPTAEPAEPVESPPEDLAEVAQTNENAQYDLVVPQQAVEPADDYITAPIPVVMVAAGDLNGLPTQVWAPLPGTPLPGPNPFGTSFTG